MGAMLADWLVSAKGDLMFRPPFSPLGEAPGKRAYVTFRFSLEPVSSVQRSKTLQPCTKDIKKGGRD